MPSTRRTRPRRSWCGRIVALSAGGREANCFPNFPGSCQIAGSYANGDGHEYVALAGVDRPLGERLRAGRTDDRQSYRRIDRDVQRNRAYERASARRCSLPLTRGTEAQVRRRAAIAAAGAIGGGTQSDAPAITPGHARTPSRPINRPGSPRSRRSRFRSAPCRPRGGRDRGVRNAAGWALSWCGIRPCAGARFRHCRPACA